MGTADPFSRNPEMSRGQPLLWGGLEMNGEEGILYGPKGEPYSGAGQRIPLRTRESERYQKLDEEAQGFSEAAAEFPERSVEEERERFLSVEEKSRITREEILARAEKEAREAEEEEKKRQHEEELAKQRASFARAQIKSKERELGESKFQRFERGAKRVATVGRGTAKTAGALVKVGTLGGPMKRPPRDMYIPKASKEMYMPTRPGGGSTTLGAPLREVSTPDLSQLRQAGVPGGGRGYGGGFGSQSGVTNTLIGQVSKGSLSGQAQVGSQGIGSRSALTRLRNITMPRGLTPAETQAYAEIKENGDVDIPSHVIEDLATLGIPRGDAIAAIKGLIRKGHIRSNSQFQNEPVLEIA